MKRKIAAVALALALAGCGPAQAPGPGCSHVSNQGGNQGTSCSS